MGNNIKYLKSSAVDLAKLITALGDKASWSPLDKGRTALNQVAECALMTGACVGIIANKAVPNFDWEAFGKAQAELETDTSALLAALADNTEALAAAIEGLSAEDAAFEVTMPWGETYTLAGLADVNYWNNTYHQGQINLIQQMVNDWHLPELEKKLLA